MTNKLFGAAALVLLAGALAAPVRAQAIEQVLVKVNGDIITRTDLESRQIAAIRQRLSQDVDPEALKSDEQLKKVVAEVTPRLLVGAIDELLMVQIKQEGMSVDDLRKNVEKQFMIGQGQAGINVAQDDDARVRAIAIRGRILAGGDFGKLAGEVSTAPSKSNGGPIGPINVSELSASLQQLLKTTKPRQGTQPVKIAKGYQILKLKTLKEASA